MGVQGLLGLLKSIHKPCNLKDFAGQTLGVDAYGWLHRGVLAGAVDLALGKPTRKHVDFALHRVRMLKHFGVTPYLVFDGDHLPSKAETEKGRAERRRHCRTTGLEMLRVGRTSMAFQELQKAVDVTPEMARQLIDELREMGVSYVVAPYEADSQLAYLEQKGFIDGIISEDSDLLVFGAQCLLTKLDQYGDCVMIQQADYTACREVNLAGWTIAEFRRMAILSGCDYLEGIHRMGLKTAHRLVRKYKTIDRVIRAAQVEGKFHIPAGYLDSYRQAEMTFLYQWVFCPQLHGLVNLNAPERRDEIGGLSYIGHYVEPELARRVATGDVNPMTKEPIIVPRPMANPFKTPNPVRPLETTSKPYLPEKSKSIDTFFKPKRTPLAELDPNSFTPSPSQHRLLQQGSRPPWSARPARAPPTSSPVASAFGNSSIQAASRTVSPASRPPKRQRLCSDVLDASPGKPPLKSKFFAPKAPPQNTKASFNIWSDDSIEDAMAELGDDTVYSAPAGPQSPPLPRTKTKLQIFCDDSRFEEMAEPDDSSAIAGTSLEDVDKDSPFSAALRKRTQTLRETFALTRPSSFAPSKHYAASYTTTTSQTNPMSSRASKCQAPTTVSKGDKEPLPARGGPGAERETHASTRASPTATPERDSAPHTEPASKGSEDLLLVPHSDAGSDAGGDADEPASDACVVASSSPPSQWQGPHCPEETVEGNGGTAADEDEDGPEGEDQDGARPRLLDIKRFAFDARAAPALLS